MIAVAFNIAAGVAGAIIWVVGVSVGYAIGVSKNESED